jgi:hypothetical protein
MNWMALDVRHIKIEYMPEAVIKLVNLYNCLPYSWTSKLNDRLIGMTQPQNENVTVATITWLPVMEYLCYKRPWICSTCRKHFPVLSSFTDKTLAKRKSTKGQTTIYKTYT